VRTVRSFAAEPTEMDRFAKVGDRASRANAKLAFHIGLFQGGCIALTIIYLLIYCIYLY
jgi:ABC-type multidrug transport system fused ATPase/permease subunit